MGELLLCSHSAASVPYYLTRMSVNIYSLEELCYCMEQNPYLFDDTFISEEFCVWVEQELGLAKLAEKLKECRKKKNFLEDMAVLILEETHYCSEESAERVVGILREMQSKSPFECRKIRADQLMGHKKYVCAALEYQKMLQMEEELKEHPVLCGKIWHNLGTAYAKLFLFREASACFYKAYAYGQSENSLICCMASCWYIKDMDKVDSLAAQYGITKEEKEEICGRFAAAGSGQETAAFSGQLEEWMRQPDGGIAKEGNVGKMLAGWKMEYIKSCEV